MDLESTIMGAILVAICALPFLMMGRNRKKRERHLFQSLTNIALQHNGKINQHEIGIDYGIGIDETNDFVFFFKQTKDKVVEECIALAEIEVCTVNKITRTVENDSGANAIIDKLELIFLPIAAKKKGVALEFFNTAVYTQLNGELQSVEKWTKRINEHLKSKK